MEFNDIIRNAASLPTTEIAADVNKALTANGCVVLTAPPGAGKSTLLPLTGWIPAIRRQDSHARTQASRCQASS